MPSHTISRCTVADSAAIAHNNIPAFWQNDNWRFSWSHRTLSQHLAEIVKRAPRNLINNRSIMRHQMAIDPETGRILGYARWKLPVSHATTADGLPVWPEALVPVVSPEEEAEIRRVAEMAVWDPNPAADGVEDVAPKCRAWIAVLLTNLHADLDYLAVHPDNQGKGIVTALVQSGMDRARELGLDIFVLAFECGLGVYKRLGFRLDKDFTLDDSKYGGPGEYHFYFMTYESSKSDV
ncbi:hypothetical protein N7510_000241 [Penicillium lagena]|uniref:uncharacterized protein n=1 Tax=Penicillium lagena TaxID=94218 RepID=UPI0025422513|nr:uncharacterized protein N7510_000241 [Penicillium lagena]KAJ5623932.1 hypothetical protein N7510_000241 [Penicillium lagena]